MKKFLKSNYPFGLFALAIIHIICMLAIPFSNMKYVAKNDDIYINSYGEQIQYSNHRTLKKEGFALFSVLYQMSSEHPDFNRKSVSIYAYLVNDNILEYNYPNSDSNTYEGSFEIKTFSIGDENINYLCPGRIILFVLDILLIITGALILWRRFKTKKRKV